MVVAAVHLDGIGQQRRAAAGQLCTLVGTAGRNTRTGSSGRAAQSDVRRFGVELVDEQLLTADLEWLLIVAGLWHASDDDVAVAVQRRGNCRLSSQEHLQLHLVRDYLIALLGRLIVLRSCVRFTT